MDAAQFLEMLYPSENRRGWFLLWAIKPGDESVAKHFWFDMAKTAAIQEICAQAKTLTDHNVYFNVALQPRNFGPGSRGYKATASCIPGFWADIDVSSPTTDGAHVKKHYPPSKEYLLELLNTSFGYEPSIIVDSGNGLHAYWLFDKPWYFRDDEENRFAERLSETWQKHMVKPLLERAGKEYAKELGQKASEVLRTKGFALDMTFDLARLLRFPGTTNTKPDMPLRPVSVIQSSASFLNLQEIVPTVNAKCEKVSSKPHLPKTTAFDIVVTPTENVNPAVRKMYDNDPEFKDVWNGVKNMPSGDNSTSTFAQSIANRLASTKLFTQQDVTEALIAWRWERHKLPPKHRSYYETTVSKAFGEFKPETVEDLQQVAIAHTEVLVSEDVVDKDKTLKILSGVFNLKIRAIKKLVSEDPLYILYAEGHKPISLGTAERLTNPAHIRMTIFKVLGGKPMKKMKQEAWDNIVELISKVIEEEFNEDNSERGETKAWLRQYIHLNNNEADEVTWQEAMQQQMAFMYTGELMAVQPALQPGFYYFSSYGGLLEFVRNTVKLSGKELGQRLKMTDICMDIKFYWRDAEQGNKLVGRNYWMLKLDDLDI